jgi:hypothetical protein
MIPIQQLELLAPILHEERIQDAQARRTEWTYAPLRLDRARHKSNSSRSLRRLIAQSLHRAFARSRRTNLADEPGH